MKYTKVLIAGANSFIASQSIPSLNFGDSEIFLVSRNFENSQFHLQGSLVKTLEIEDFSDDTTLEKLAAFLRLNPTDKLLIINFIGSFGSVDSLNELDLRKFSSEVDENLIPFLTLSKLVAVCESGLFLSFAGAGVGSGKLEVASLSYLASKASIVVLVEGLDGLLQGGGIRVGAISPGAFPSRMQKVVAETQNSSSVSKERREKAVETMQSSFDSSKLIAMLNFLIANPDIAGGRVWSANYDSPIGGIIREDFGKFRRVF